jgi:hypothetical protein
MSRVTKVVLIVVFLAAASLGAGTYAAGALQGIEFEKVTSNVGRLKEGEKAAVLFHFRNRGLTAATIVSLQPNCGLHASIVRGRVLAPGQDGEIEARVQSTGRPTIFQGTIVVTVRDPIERTISLSVNGTIEREFTVEQKVIDFGTITKESNPSAEIRVQSIDGRDRIISAYSTDDSFEAHLLPDGDKSTMRIAVGNRFGSTPGFKFGTIRIRTSSVHMPELIVPVRAYSSATIANTR